jgi:hypothetical protein
MMYLRQMLSDLGQTSTELKLGLRGILWRAWH